MKYRVNHSPTFSVLEVDLNDQESVRAQPNSMLSMTSGIQIGAAMGGGGKKSSWLSGFKNLAGGENFFTAVYRAKRDGEQVCLAPDVIGEILPIELTNEEPFYLTRGSYLANLGDVELGVKYSGVKGWMSKKGLFLLTASGTGTLFCQTHGAIVVKELADGETFFVDNRFVVAFSQSIDYQLVKATASVKDSVLSGEGFVNRYTGPGAVYYQTRGKPGSGLLGRALDAVF